MAHFASLHYSRKALKWHSNLPLDVRQDWFKQEKALLERWPAPADESDDEEAEASIVPTPAAASLLSAQAGKSSEIGVLQFVSISGNENPLYIAGLRINGECTLTTAVGEALRLQWGRSVNLGSRILECVDSGSEWLAIHWKDVKPSFATGSTTWARLTVVDSDTLAPATLTASDHPITEGPFRINVWRLSTEGQTTLVWKDGVTGKETQLETFRSASFMYISVDQNAYQAENRDERRGRLVFRPVE
ncbi:hypothetical protein FRC05_006234 [Tulasnella sp. 425]|nr:hypothetical protein FRC05_006234 [Tulasnella sp. 425]